MLTDLRKFMKRNTLIQESIDKTIKKFINEKYNRTKSFDTIIENVINEQIHLLKEADEKIGTKKHAVIQWLQKPEIDTAEIRRKLEGEPEDQAEEDSKRSYFMKKVNQTYGKDFSDDEINSLYSIKTSLGQ